ncbi:putative cell cycle-associated protein [Blastocladiella britannica]|nr:putative cell cycle-associated protein [Blastocladiella britannica]
MADIASALLLLSGTNAGGTTAPVQRNVPGTKWEDFYASFAPVPALDALDSPFAYQEYLQAQVRLRRHEPEHLVAVPPDGDPLVWQYEHLRQFCSELSIFVVALDAECSTQSCPQMKANEWQYLCAAHPSPQHCCAFDYIVHTLDGACGLLNNPKYFPSRVSMPGTAGQQFANIARRLYRIFAHAFFHHRAAFERAEVESALYARFLAFVLRFDLMGMDTILIPQQVPL